MDVKTLITLSVLMLSVIVKPNLSQYYGNNYNPYMRAPSPLAPPIHIGRPSSLTVHRGVYSDEYDDYEQPKYNRNKARHFHAEDKDCTEEEGRFGQDGRPAPPTSLVLIPYPYALVVPNLDKINTTATTTTTAATPGSVPERVTSTVQPKDSQSKENEPKVFQHVYCDGTGKECVKCDNRDRKNCRPCDPNKDCFNRRQNRYNFNRLMTSNTKWVPKYGIVPLPDNLAETLISELSNETMQPKNRRIVGPYTRNLINMGYKSRNF